jgi:hypothetical protein
LTLQEVCHLYFSSFPNLIIIPPMFHTDTSLPPWVRKSPDQAAIYHVGSLSGISFQTCHQAEYRVGKPVCATLLQLHVLQSVKNGSLN